MRTLKQLALVLGTGCIFVYFSEHLFWVTRLIDAAFLAYFAFVTVPAAPISLLILPLLLGLVYYGLHRHRTVETNDTLITTLHGRIHPLNVLAILALPLTAIAFYALALSLNLQWHTNWILYLITTPLGFILFGVGLFKKREQKPGFSEKPGF